jgi:hypothetical protein
MIQEGGHEFPASVKGEPSSKEMFSLQREGEQISGCRPGAEMAVCRAFQRTGEFKWELVKSKAASFE